MTDRGTIPKELLEAYRRTEFRVLEGPWAFTLRIGEAAPALAACHAAFGVTESAYITAWNPRSQPQTLAENDAAQARLEAELRNAGYVFLRGEGIDPTGNWPGEASVLVLGMSVQDAARIGDAYEQNAIVVAGRDAVAELRLLHGPAAQRAY